MKAFIVDQYKKTDVRWLGEMPMPNLEVNDVLVKIHAASINHAGQQDHRVVVQCVAAPQLRHRAPQSKLIRSSRT